MSRLAVAEEFYSIQGEGPHAGTPAIFLRLAGCNLSCGWDDDLDEYEPGDEPQGDAAWVCDTIDVWKEPEFTISVEDMVTKWTDKEWTQKLSQGAHIVLTGGEPTLPAHQSSFQTFYQELPESPFVEVETNGTQNITQSFRECVDQFNVSMKLSNSGHSYDERVNKESVTEFVNMGSGMVMFKFVVSNEDDLMEVMELTTEFSIPSEMVSLMPAGQRREQLQETYPLVAEFCKETGYKFSPRLHVNVWNSQTGV